MTNNTIPLEILLSYPLFWKPAKVCDFLKVAHQILRGDRDTGEIVKFNEELERAALKCKLWSGNKNWKDVVDKYDPCHFEYVTTRYSKSQDKETKEWKYSMTPFLSDYKYRKFSEVDKEEEKSRLESSAVYLFDVIRDKHQHCDDIHPQARKHSLGWYTVEGHFSQQLFVEYWTERFPRLVPFLWLKFFEITRPTLSEGEYYKYSLDSHWDDLPVTWEDLLRQMNASLTSDLCKGGVKSRFIKDNTTLEFRTLAVDSIQGILHGSSVSKIQFSRDRMTCNWNAVTDQCGTNLPEKIEITYPSKIATVNCHDIEKLIIILGNSIYDVEKQILKDNWEDRDSRKIIFFTASNPVSDEVEIISRVAKHIFNCDNISNLEQPIKWKEVRQSVPIDRVKEWKLKLQNEIIEFKNIVPIDDINSVESILSHLEGSLLCQLLKGNVPTLLANHELPLRSGSYLDRKITKRMRIDLDTINRKIPNDVFVFIGTVAKELEETMRLDTKITITDNVDLGFASESAAFGIFIFEGEVFEFNEAISGGRTDCKNKKVHVVRYSNGYFEWFVTHCFDDEGKVKCNHLSCEGRKADEKLFVSEMESDELSERLVLFANKPGMGKSEWLKSLSEILARFKDRFVIFLEMNSFVTKIDKENFTPKDTLDLIVKTVCGNEFETELLHYWINNKHYKTTKVEILCDGLDEIQSEYREKVLKILNEIQGKSVRVWSTVRDHMLIDIHTKFGLLGYKLEPFIKKDQIKFFKEHWKKYWEKCYDERESDTGWVYPNDKDLEALAEQCIALPLSAKEREITGVPLQCLMIAEINERRIKPDKVELGGNKRYSLIELYKEMIERKLEVCLKVKKKLSQLNMNDYFANSARDNMDRAHIYFSLKLVISVDIAEKFKTLLLPMTSDWEELESAVKDYGLIQKFQPLTFVHRTFAEFIIAQFVYRVLTGHYSNLSRDDEQLQYFIWNEVLTVSCTQRGNYFKFRTVSHFLNVICETSAQLKSLNFCAPLQEIAIIRWRFKVRLAEGTPTFDEKEGFLEAAWNSAIKNCRLFGLLFATGLPSIIIGMFIEALELKLHTFCQYVIDNNPYFKPDNWKILLNYADKQFSILHWYIIGLPKYFELIYDRKHKKFTNEIHKIQGFMKLILESDISLLNQPDVQGRTPLSLLLSDQPNFKLLVLQDPSVQLGPKKLYRRILDMFKKYKANFNAIGKDGRSLLHVGFDTDFDIDIIKDLIDYGADIYAVNSNGQSAIHLAVERKNFSLVKLLVIEKNVDLDLRDLKGKRVFDYVTSKDIRDFLNDRKSAYD